MKQPYSPPKFRRTAFNCPGCHAYASQVWCEPWAKHSNDFARVVDLMFARCSHCNKHSIWRQQEMIYPEESRASLPSSDMPEDVARDYEEARSILLRSPRGAASLLRLCIQKLCISLGEPGRDLNADIGSLVARGLNPKVQRSLDVVRVIGNEAVHPGQIDLHDDVDTASNLCELVNLIVESMITQPRIVDALYEKLPESKKEQIVRRDSEKS
jgi:hypothetical protein